MFSRSLLDVGVHSTSFHLSILYAEYVLCMDREGHYTYCPEIIFAYAMITP